MNLDKVIFEFTPPTTSERIKSGVQVCCLMFFVIMCVTTWKIAFGLALIIGLAVFVIIWLRVSFDGWSIKEQSIILKRSDFTYQPKQVEIFYSEIINIKYFKPVPKRPCGIELKTKIKTYFVRNCMDIFELADTLKFLKLKGINVELAESDHEIELYLSGKIELTPLNNKY